MIYISTGGFNKKSVIEVIKLLSKNNIKAFELSGGIYIENLELKLKDLSRYNKDKENFSILYLDDQIAKRTIGCPA